MIDHLPAAVVDPLSAFIGTIKTVTPIGGGCIANASRIEASTGVFFLKWGTGEVAKTFAAEAAGLEALRAADTALHIPEVIGLSVASPGFLVMEWIEEGGRRAASARALGEALAQLHRVTGDAYGFSIDNYIGRSVQLNTQTNNWADFFRQSRFAPQVAMARQRHRWQSDWNAGLERLYQRLPDLLPQAPPASLLHGDLWAGNYFISAAGRPVLFDPASYFGDRETDLAMTELFGGFDAGFYDAYRTAWPLAPGYTDRRIIYNLYHILNHLNLFGDAYAGQIGSILARF